MPRGFFDALAAVWTLVLEAADIPRAWQQQVRCVLLPKPDRWHSQYWHGDWDIKCFVDVMLKQLCGAKLM